MELDRDFVNGKCVTWYVCQTALNCGDTRWDLQHLLFRQIRDREVVTDILQVCANMCTSVSPCGRVCICGYNPLLRKDTCLRMTV